MNFNDGWGILASSGNIDGGANTASGNAEPGQCSGVVCTIGLAPGAPDTTIVDKPAPVTSSQYALFTFIGTDDTTPLSGLEFECRLDSTSDLDWVECENPQEYFGVAPGTHTFEVRALDQNEQPDPTPASYTWTYSALPTGVAPNTFIDLAPPLASPVLEGFFTFSSNEPDVTFECSLDAGPFSTCEFVYEFAFEEFEVGQHTFRVRATDFEGNTDPTPATYTWVVTGIVTTVTGGPAYEPSGEPGEPANGGETTDTTAVITFEANVADATFICSIDLGPFTACTSPVTYTGLAVGEHLFQVLATDPETEAEQIEVTEYEWTVISGDDTVPPTTLITSAPADNSSSTIFTFAGADDQTQPLALAFECRLDSTLEADFSDCVSPFNLLDEFPEFAPGEHTFEVRAVDNAEPDGNVDPTPASHSWTSVADTVPPETTLLTGPARDRRSSPTSSSPSAGRTTRRPSSSSCSSARSTAARSSRATRRRACKDSSPACTPSKFVRSTWPGTSTRRRPASPGPSSGRRSRHSCPAPLRPAPPRRQRSSSRAISPVRRSSARSTATASCRARRRSSSSG